jgi:ComF family protein
MEWTRAPVCGACLDAIEPLEAPYFCKRCGLPFEEAAPLHGVSECGLCRRQPWAFEAARSYGAYEGDLRRLIHLFKYDRMLPLAGPIARRMADCMGALGPVDVIVAVPLYRLRRWRRGFNQALELGRQLSRHSRVPLEARGLARNRATRPQSGLSNRERRTNVQGAFVARRPERLRDRRVLLIDDVMTTGATMGACAQALKATGAREVFALTAARAKRRITSWEASP